MAIMHFDSTAERLRFLRQPKQEVKPVEVKAEDNKFADEEEKPKKKKSSKKKTSKKKEKEDGAVQA